jgi:predicted TIM-barrel fold metal-dependent hydrolase
MEAAIKICGADHVLFGSTFPVYKGWMAQGVDLVKGMDISEEDRELVFSGNAIRLFDLKV